jgi:hypothetical protein
MAVFTPGKALRRVHYQNGAHCCLSSSVGSYFGNDLALLLYIAHKNPSVFYVPFNRWKYYILRLNQRSLSPNLTFAG